MSKNRRKIRKKPEVKTIEPKIRLGTIAKIIGAAAIGIAGAAYYLSIEETKKSNPSSPPAQVEKSQNNLDKYVESTEQFGNDPSKRNLYIIFQIHLDDGWDIGYMGETFKELFHLNAKQASLESQVNIFRIVESLDKRSLAKVVSVEGCTTDYRNDINNPGYMKDKVDPKGEGKFDRIVKAMATHDEIVMKQIMNTEAGGAEQAGWLYEDLYLIGWENAELNSTCIKALKESGYKRCILDYHKNEIDMSILDDPSFREKLRMSPELANQLKADVQRLRDNPKELEKYRKEYAEAIRTFDEANTKRSNLAIANTLKITDELYQSGRISNQNAIIVIGSAHEKDYENIKLQCKEGKLDYNLVCIHPRNPAKKADKP